MLLGEAATGCVGYCLVKQLVTAVVDLFYILHTLLGFLCHTSPGLDYSTFMDQAYTCLSCHLSPAVHH